jgi:quercetin dioxygenase-like cupin family protein
VQKDPGDGVSTARGLRRSWSQVHDLAGGSLDKENSMNRLLVHTVALSIVAIVAAPLLMAADPQGPMQPEEMKWGPAPPVLTAGAEMVVLAGDPGKSGPVTLRLKMPAGYVIAPHWHPTDERVTVISGHVGLGMGDTLDKKNSKLLKPGGYAIAPANMHHFAWTKTGGIVQVDLMGPFAITYVNAADDPSKKK